MKARRFSFYFLMPISVLFILIIILLIQRGSLGPQKQLDNSVLEEVVTQQKTKSGVVEGRVIDESGELLHHYLVTATSADEKIIYEARTDVHGRFEFSKLDTGIWKISVKLSEIEFDSAEVTLKADAHETVDFSLPMKGAISGTLVSATNAITLDINGSIELGLVTDSWQIPSRIFTGTILDGKFMFTGLPPGLYVVMNSIPGYALLRETNTMITVEPNQQATNIEIPLEDGALVRGRLVDINSVPIPDLVVRIASIRIAPKVYSPTKYIRESQTDVNGVFSVMVPCSPDRTHAFYIILNNPGFQGNRVENDIVPGKSLYEIGDIQLEKTFEIVGKILTNVRKDNLEVVLQRHGKSPAPMPIHVPTRETIPVNSDGKFAISGLYPIPYTLAVMDDGMVRYFLDGVNPQETKTLNITLQKTEIIQGQVTDLEETPLTGVTVTAKMRGGSAGAPSITLSECVSQDDGTFKLELLKVKPENVRLVIAKNGFLAKAHEKSEFQSIDEFKVVLEKGVSLVGHVIISPELSQKGDFTIKLFPGDMSMQPGTERGFDDRKPILSRNFERADGSFSIEGLARTDYRLYVVGEGLAPTNIRVDLTNGDKDVNIFVKSSIANLTGRLLWANTKEPVKDAIILRSWYPWELEPYYRLGDFQKFDININAHGVFKLQDVFEGGRYLLEIRCTDPNTNKIGYKKRVIRKQIEVFAGQGVNCVIYVGKED